VSVLVAPPPRLVDRRLAIQVIDDLLNALELWQSAGVTDAGWVGEVWSRRVAPCIAMELPLAARASADGASVHAALLEWQMDLAEGLG
jgi:hypothetical protein